MPPMKVPSRTPRETADEPMISWSSWNHTTSYTSAAAPLPTKSSHSRGSADEGELVVVGRLVVTDSRQCYLDLGDGRSRRPAESFACHTLKIERRRKRAVGLRLSNSLKARA